jgi:hypothetical protein
MTPLFMAELGASRTRQAAGFSAADIRDFETIGERSHHFRVICDPL